MQHFGKIVGENSVY